MAKYWLWTVPVDCWTGQKVTRRPASRGKCQRMVGCWNQDLGYDLVLPAGEQARKKNEKTSFSEVSKNGCSSMLVNTEQAKKLLGEVSKNGQFLAKSYFSRTPPPLSYLCLPPLCCLFRLQPKRIFPGGEQNHLLEFTSKELVKKNFIFFFRKQEI